MRSRWRLAIVIAASLSALDVSADAVAPVRVMLVGNEAVGLRLSSGTTIPCDSKDDVPIFEGVVKPGTTDFESGAVCVCWQQTYAPFVATGWSAGSITCRPTTKKRIDMTKPLVVALTSHEP
jgi:hypothetical protein